MTKRPSKQILRPFVVLAWLPCVAKESNARSLELIGGFSRRKSESEWGIDLKRGLRPTSPSRPSFPSLNAFSRPTKGRGEGLLRRVLFIVIRTAADTKASSPSSSWSFFLRHESKRANKGRSSCFLPHNCVILVLQVFIAYKTVAFGMLSGILVT